MKHCWSVTELIVTATRSSINRDHSIQYHRRRLSVGLPHNFCWFIPVFKHFFCAYKPPHSASYNMWISICASACMIFCWFTFSLLCIIMYSSRESSWIWSTTRCSWASPWYYRPWGYHSWAFLPEPPQSHWSRNYSFQIYLAWKKWRVVVFHFQTWPRPSSPVLSVSPWKAKSLWPHTEGR